MKDGKYMKRKTRQMPDIRDTIQQKSMKVPLQITLVR